MTANIDRLFDLLDEAGSMTAPEARAALGGWSQTRFEETVRALRLFLDEDETLDRTLVATRPLGPSGPWVYALTADPEEARPWQTEAVVGIDTRLRTLRAVVRPLRRGADGRTVEGRKLRVIERTLDYLLATLDDLVGVEV